MNLALLHPCPVCITITVVSYLIYKKYKYIKSVTHTHSEYATAWAQASRSIPLIGTTHADYWEKEIPIIKFINKKDINKDYELFTGKMIVENIVKKAALAGLNG